ncbi:RNA polymerase sigma-70 factor [Variovorax sp. HJSM1_2]|uniref:RNA polymerase sigma-70 factor n=1 Tax=Variovorax sp. HJSM1_2 TaxID=3366263 RepID=UPI003BDAAFFC
MDTRTTLFHQHRPRLMGVAYRMLGSRADAEDVLQDAWLRWNESDVALLRNPEAWLVTVVTRLSIDRLRAVRGEREAYPGLWLPEPLLAEEVPAEASASPEHSLETAQDISLAFLTLLERLSPEERAAFLLRQVFGAEYAEVAEALGKTEAACRQLVSRAAAQLKAERPRFTVSRETHLQLLRRFADAASQGDFQQIKQLLAEDAELVGDGGAKVANFGKILRGAQRLAQLYFAVALRHGKSMRLEIAEINGQPGLLRYIDGQLESIQEIETDGERIVAIHTQRNPDKLAQALMFRGR